MLKQIIKVAIIDLYNNEPNEGMRGIQEILDRHVVAPNQEIVWTRFDLRFKMQIPDLSYDIYISSGGPGSPLAEDSPWERAYFKLMDDLLAHNKSHHEKKFVFLICHSFQLMCRHLNLAEVKKRHSKAFGIFPIQKVEAGFEETILKNLAEYFYAVDSREWQVIQPKRDALLKFGAKILALEKERPHVPFERALMGIRFTSEMIGTQFHPEADPVGMLNYLHRQEQKEHIIEHHGIEKYHEMLSHLYDDDKIALTQASIIPSFLDEAIAQIPVYIS